MKEDSIKKNGLIFHYASIQNAKKHFEAAANLNGYTEYIQSSYSPPLVPLIAAYQITIFYGLISCFSFTLQKISS